MLPVTQHAAAGGSAGVDRDAAFLGRGRLSGRVRRRRLRRRRHGPQGHLPRLLRRRTGAVGAGVLQWWLLRGLQMRARPLLLHRSRPDLLQAVQRKRGVLNFPSFHPHSPLFQFIFFQIHPFIHPFIHERHHTDPTLPLVLPWLVCPSQATLGWVTCVVTTVWGCFLPYTGACSAGCYLCCCCVSSTFMLIARCFAFAAPLKATPTPASAAASSSSRSSSSSDNGNGNAGGAGGQSPPSPPSWGGGGGGGGFFALPEATVAFYVPEEAHAEVISWREQDAPPFPDPSAPP